MNSASCNREGFSESAPRLGCGYEFWDNYFSRCLGWIAESASSRIQESACGCSAGTNSGNHCLRYPATSRIAPLALDHPFWPGGTIPKTSNPKTMAWAQTRRARNPHPRAQRPGATAAALQWTSCHNSRTFRSLINAPCQMSKSRSPQPGIK